MSGWKKLAQQAAEYISDEIAFMEHDKDVPGDSPIERLLFASLVILVHVKQSEYRHVFEASKVSVESLKEQEDARFSLIVEPQVQFEFGRVDFVVHAYDWGTWSKKPEGWRRLIVECDGHNFHERTKEQAAKDRSRDREALLAGLDVFRFTGSEIYRDPWGCAEKIIDWAAKGLY